MSRCAGRTVRGGLSLSLIKRLFSAGVLAGAASVLAPSAFAQSPVLPSGLSSTGSTDLRATVQEAITTNPEVQAAWQEFQAAGQDRRAAWGNYLPSIDVAAGTGRADREFDNRGSYDTDYAEVTLTQMLYDGFATSSDVERLDRAQLVRYYELLGASEDVALEAVRAYLDVQRYRELVGLAQANYRKHLEVFNQVEDRTLSGAGRGVDLEQISGRLALAESNLMTEASNLHDVTVRYQRIVGELPAAELASAPTFGDRLPGDVSRALELAFQGNPDFHAAIEDIEASRAERQGTTSAFHPQLDLVARSGTYRDSNSTSLQDLDRRQDRHSVELVASMNLYRGGSDLASYRAASERVEQAIDLRRKACVDIRQTTQVAYNDTRRLREQLRYLNEHRVSTNRVRRAYQQQFDIGQRSLLDVLDTENEYFDASRAYVNAQYDVALADARTLAVMGQLMQVLDVRRDDMPTLDELGSDGVTLDADTVCPAPGPSGYTLEDFTRTASPITPDTPDVTLSADTLFAPGSATLSPEARQELGTLAERIRGRDDLTRVVIAGHADATGTDAVNEPLSRRRAESVGDYLVTQGVPAALIQAQGFGSRQPVASNATVDGRQRNRRVDITLEDSGASVSAQ
ncbi:TolC family outer membrane protein [Halomonas organivorans]|uniref:TolC family outer membrane protein n=1 Tax=Halomonas organivorans TaxID=257772 RepID=UPI00160A3BB5|nr:TolC family outer membrane protein [Halomonas organivorans]